MTDRTLPLALVLAMAFTLLPVAQAANTQVYTDTGAVAGLTTKDPFTNNGENREYRIHGGQGDWKTVRPGSALSEVTAEVEWDPMFTLTDWLRLRIGILANMGDAALVFIDVEGPSPLTGVADQARINELLALNHVNCKPTSPCRMAYEVTVGTGMTGLALDAGFALAQPYAVRVEMTYSG